MYRIFNNRPDFKKWVKLWLEDWFEEFAAEKVPPMLDKIYGDGPKDWFKTPKDPHLFVLDRLWFKLPKSWRVSVLLRAHMLTWRGLPVDGSADPVPSGVVWGKYTVEHQGKIIEFEDILPDDCEMPLSVGPKEKESRERRWKEVQERQEKEWGMKQNRVRVGEPYGVRRTN